MYEPHPEIGTPPDDTVIWRYLNFEKLIALISTSSLFFARIDKFKDPWEGKWPRNVIEELKKLFPPGAFDKSLGNFDKVRKTFFVNCWHINNCESAALWDLYANGTGFSVKSSVGKLKHGIKESGPFYIGQVKYINYETGKFLSSGALNAFSPVFYKRQSFEHECELRVLVWEMKGKGGPIDWDAMPNDHQLEVDLNALIETIYIAPKSPEWLPRIMKLVLDAFDLPDISVIPSRLYDECAY